MEDLNFAISLKELFRLNDKVHMFFSLSNGAALYNNPEDDYTISGGCHSHVLIVTTLIDLKDAEWWLFKTCKRKRCRPAVLSEELQSKKEAKPSAKQIFF